MCDSDPESFLFFGDEKSFSAIGMASLPLSLTIPMPPSPNGVEMAAIVSSVIKYYTQEGESLDKVTGYEWAGFCKGDCPVMKNIMYTIASALI